MNFSVERILRLEYFGEKYLSITLIIHPFKYILIVNDNDVVLQKKKKKNRIPCINQRIIPFEVHKYLLGQHFCS